MRIFFNCEADFTPKCPTRLPTVRDIDRVDTPEEEAELIKMCKEDQTVVAGNKICDGTARATKVDLKMSELTIRSIPLLFGTLPPQFVGSYSFVIRYPATAICW